MNTKLMMAVGAAALAIAAFGKPQGGPPGGNPPPGGDAPRPIAKPAPVGHHKPAPPPARPHGGGKDHSSREFWAGVAGGVVGGLAAGVVAPPPRPVTTVVTTPAVVAPAPVVVTPAPVVVTPAPVVQRVWVEGRYIDQVQPNGTVLRVWQPAHYESRTVVQ